MSNESHKPCPDCGSTLSERGPNGECLVCARAKELAASQAGLGPTFIPQPTSQDWLADAAWLKEVLPDYTLISEIGRGGMGRVLQAKHEGLDRLVAIKILTVDLQKQDDFVLRFQREARAMARLQHPNIVQVFDYGQRGNDCYIVMEFVGGPNLRQLILQGLQPDQALAIVPQICDALQYAHDQGVIHRDVKPANVLLRSDGTVKVADFGLAKVVHGDTAPDMGLTQSGWGMGTAGYMAPEQEKDVAHVDHRADIFSLGVMLYEMLTGERPTGRFTKPSKRVKVGRSVDEVILKSIEYQPDQRFQKVSEVKAALGRSTVIRRGVGNNLSRRPGVRWDLVLAGAGVGIVLLVLFINLSGLFTSDPEPSDRGEVPVTGVKPPPKVKPLPDEGESVVGTKTPEPAPVALADVVLVKAKLDQQWERMKGFDRGQGVGAKLDEADRLMRAAETFFEKEAYGEAMAVYTNVNGVVEQLNALQSEREVVRRLRDEVAAEIEEAKPDVPHGPALWKQVERMYRSGVAAFEKAEFEQAGAFFGEASEACAEAKQAETRLAEMAAQAAAAEAARKADLAAKEAAIMAAKEAASTPPKEPPVTVKTPEPEQDVGKARGAVAGEKRTVLINNDVELDVVWIPAGRFVMGSPEEEEDRKSDEFAHDVELTRGYWIGATEVTQDQFWAVTGRSPSHFNGKGKNTLTVIQWKAVEKTAKPVVGTLPVENVSWDDAQAFCKAVTIKTADPLAGWQVRLPTEAEWEYACRAGSRTATSFGDSLSATQANFDGRSPYGPEAAKGDFLKETKPVASYEPNAWGLYDMHGNVWEWCEDWYDKAYYENSVRKDPVRRNGVRYRVNRGGGWDDEGDDCRSARRDWHSVNRRRNNYGFRIVIGEP